MWLFGPHDPCMGMASEGWMMIWNWYGVIFSKFWPMGSK